MDNVLKSKTIDNNLDSDEKQFLIDFTSISDDQYIQVSENPIEDYIPKNKKEEINLYSEDNENLDMKRGNMKRKNEAKADKETTSSEESNNSESDWCKKATVITVAFIVILMAGLIVGNKYVKVLLVWLESMDPIVSLIILAGLFFINSLPGAWGISICMLAAGYLYGFISGVFAMVFSATVSLVLSMLLLRNLCSSYIREKFYTKNVEAIINVISGFQGMKVVALTRVTPIPFGLQNAIFALSGIAMHRYVVSSVAGLLPMIITNCYIGSTLRDIHELLADRSTRVAGYIFFGAQIVITALLSWFVVQKARSELNRAMDKSTGQDKQDSNGINRTIIVKPTFRS